MNELGIIEINGLTKTYQVGNVPVHALRASTSRYGSGSLWQLSVLPALKVDPVPCAWGLTPATSGTVRINGRDLAGMNESERVDLRKATVGFVFQKYNLLPTLSAEDNIRIVQYIAGRDSASDPAFLEVLRLLGIEDRMKHKPRALSGDSSRGWRSPAAL
jgi:putative ABC transport system ATP-binding protein